MRLLVGVIAVSSVAIALGGRVAVARSVGSGAVVVRVSPFRSLEDQAIDIHVTGLAPAERVTIELRSSDARHVAWRSDAIFVASSHGVVDTTESSSRGGSYTGVWSLGLIAAMSSDGRTGLYYAWPGNTSAATFAVSVMAKGRRLAATRFRRAWGRTPLVEHGLSVRTSGVAGTFFAPRDVRGRPAVLVFGGSAGGIATWVELLARRLASDGYPALALAYFDAPGLPQALEDIPLEYFRRSLEWMTDQRQVSSARIAVLGVSRGSEAALLLGVHYPSFVHGVIALDPTNHAGCGIKSEADPPCIGPSWTIDGRPVPYSREFDDPSPTDVPASVIPVERLEAPLLLACGGSDTVWISCTYSDAILSRLSEFHSKIRRALYAYPAADHGLGTLLPDEPGSMQFDTAVPSDERGREALWPHVLAFVRRLG